MNVAAGESGARFGVAPGGEGPGEGGYTEWLHAMRLVARLPAGVPQHFRKKVGSPPRYNILSILISLRELRKLQKAMKTNTVGTPINRHWVRQNIRQRHLTPVFAGKL